MPQDNLAEVLPLNFVDQQSRDQAGQVRSLLDDYIKRTEFKRLINQVVMAQVKQGFRSLAVLSEFSGEGRTFFAAALALAYARYLIGRVLIADTVRQPRNQTLYYRAIRGQYRPESFQPRAEVAPGLIDLLSTSETEAAAQGTSDFLLCSYIDSIKHRYDLVIVDTCAMSEVSQENIDPIVAARHVDTSILLTSQRSGERTLLLTLKRRLEQYQIPVLGTVFNRGTAG